MCFWYQESTKYLTGLIDKKIMSKHFKNNVSVQLIKIHIYIYYFKDLYNAFNFASN